MPKGMLGRKVGMTQVFDETGQVVPATVIQAGPCVVMQVKDADRDGYAAVQLGFEDKARHRATQPERGHARKAGAEPKRVIREFDLVAGEALEPGQEITVGAFDGVTLVDVTGVTKGRGFSGVVRRHGFHGLRASHGVERKHRSGGSIGMSATPSRVIKGTKMAGQLGHVRRTERNLRVLQIDPENHLLVVKGAVPGPVGGCVEIRQAVYQRVR